MSPIDIGATVMLVIAIAGAIFAHFATKNKPKAKHH